MSLRSWIALCVILSASLVGSALAVVAIQFVSAESRRLHLESARAVVQELALAAEGNVLTDDRVALTRQLESVRTAHPDFRFLYVVRDGKVLAHTFPEGFPSDLLGAASTPSSPDEAPLTLIDEQNRTVFALSEAVVGEHSVRVHAGVDADRIQASGSGARRVVLVLAGLFLLWNLIFAGWLSGRIEGMVRRMTHLTNERVRLEEEIHRREQTEEELQKARDAAVAASRAKSEFLANMSHEIRTPMNGILGMTELALHTELTSEQRSYLGMAKTSAEALLGLLNDILDFSKIEAGKLDLDPHDFLLRESLGDTMKTLALRAHEKGLELACRAEFDVPDVLVGDALRLRQVLVNLIGNAIKFTSRGDVIVSVGLEAESPETIDLRFSVADTGIGIAPDKQQKVFDAFTQADGSTTRKFGGTGLGLAISARLIALMGGRIQVESEPGKGSTFSFTARFGRSTEAALKPMKRPIDLEALPVLVVDDHATNRQILVELLTHWRMTPTAVASGYQALSTLRQAAAVLDPYPLVLIDALMPEMDGFTLVEQIRRDPGLAGATILMLSSADRGADAARCRELGVAVYLIKPIKQSELLDAILTALGSVPLTQPEPLPRQKPPSVAVRELHILLAEDNEVNQELAVRTLQKRGHTVVVAANGQEALDAWQAQPFDVILMDVQMPEMDGLAASAAIRACEQETGGHTPIVALTAHAMKGDRERCLAAGMDDYVAKPLRADELFRTLARVVAATLPATEARLAAVAPGRSESASGNGSSGPHRREPLGTPVFDRQIALNRVEEDRELLLRMVQLFAQQSGGLLADIRTSVERGDGTGLQRAAHKLKGSLDNFGANRATGLAFRLEVMGRNSQLAGAARACTELEEEIASLQQALTAWTAEGVR